MYFAGGQIHKKNFLIFTPRARLRNLPLTAAPASLISPSHSPCGSSPRALLRGSVFGVSSGRRRVPISDGRFLDPLSLHRTVGFPCVSCGCRHVKCGCGFVLRIEHRACDVGSWGVRGAVFVRGLSKSFRYVECLRHQDQVCAHREGSFGVHFEDRGAEFPCVFGRWPSASGGLLCAR